MDREKIRCAILLAMAIAGAALHAAAPGRAHGAGPTPLALLNASYDPTRELFEE